MNLFKSMALKVRTGSVLLPCYLMLLIGWSFPCGLLVTMSMQENRNSETASSEFEEMNNLNTDRNGTYLANALTAEEFLLEVVAAGSMGYITISDEGRECQQYHEFNKLK